MSTPISSFSKLSLSSKMQKPSPGEGKQPVNDPDPDPPGDNDEDDSSDDDSSDDGMSFAVDHCRKVGDYYAFQLACAEVVNYSIRVKRTSPISCDDGNCTEDGVCQHIQWLLKQLSHTRGENDAGGPYQHISTLGIERICEELHWELKEASDPPEDTHWELKKQRSASRHGVQARGISHGRRKAVQNMMDAILAGEHRLDISEQDISIENIFVPLDIEATLCKMLLVDDEFFYQFNSLISRSDRYLFYKLRAEAKGAFLLLDQYILSGPITGQEPHDVPWCARTLVAIVDSIAAATFTQLSRSAKEDAVQALVYILQEVVKNRNHDIYANISWSHRPASGERDIDRNLYKLLIGTSSRSNPAEDNFIITTLQGVRDAAERSVDDLEEIITTIGSPGFGAPPAYLSKLTALVKQLKSGPASSTTAGKRQGEGLQRQGGKRMK